ncbi:LOW QUALITY PROTEIN: hypothetical protein Cgig2_000655 [Carnegiea gigantea]|uniref:DUF4283 domain-containing protein n=1 Tax=Carnegiea gigantea TaxID=171969 RepID=A0A9Q1JFI9_9CARY|nr:LOW QUALITY PROTEIN: hypothetical protein Cgig2_000655 [Carnegiea gigantea]
MNCGHIPASAMDSNPTLTPAMNSEPTSTSAINSDPNPTSISHFDPRPTSTLIPNSTFVSSETTLSSSIAASILNLDVPAMAAKLRKKKQVVVEDNGWSDWCSTRSDEYASEDDPCDSKTSLEDEDIVDNHVENCPNRLNNPMINSPRVAQKLIDEFRIRGDRDAKSSIINGGNGTVNPQSVFIHDHNQVTTQSSYTSLVDPDEGSELKFVPACVVNGVRCMKLDKEDVSAKIGFWQQAVLCSVLGANPPFKAKYAIDKIVLFRKGVFLVQFVSMHDELEVVKKGVFYFDSKPLIVKGWNPEMDMHTDDINSLPIWVQLPALDIKYWGAESLSKIGSTIGIPLKTNRYTKDRTMLKYARLLINVSLDSPFLNFIEFLNDHDVLIRQQVVYEWKPVKCSHCHMTLSYHKGCKQLLGEGVHMVSISSWNIRGLNWPNEQEDVHSFLQFNKVGMRGLLETKVKEKNTDPLIYCYVTQLYTHRKFDITFVYGMNQEKLREDIWADLQTLAQSINEAWCILGDFNSMLYKDDRKGGTEDHEVNDLTNLIEQCDLQELRCIGSYFSWSNKRVWSRIDRVFTNVL